MVFKSSQRYSLNYMLPYIKICSKIIKLFISKDDLAIFMLPQILFVKEVWVLKTRYFCKDKHTKSN